ncbi:MAG TPA: exodeoxyribonuclease VII large subunit [Anaerolineae bacterium]|nr:exodeoxyribonuclease VII large subunit [Anaerolineae bacterium]
MQTEQLSFFRSTTWTVIGITQYIRGLFESDHNLQDVRVRGEVSNFSQPRSGHVYFTLKDESASLRCVMWRNTVMEQSFLPKDGDAVEVHGSITIYEAGGQYQLYADEILPLGRGALYQEFLRLKEQLQSEGLFDESRKRPIPQWPHTIGIITSPTGAALRDMLNTLRRRYPLVNVVLAPTTVQGDDAPPGIAAAIKALNNIIKPDVILLARGGGSIEDLWAFNDPRVAYAIAASEAPLISGVGHQTDFTIVDFVADLRAPTPTAAAELATPDRAELMVSLSEINQRLVRGMLAIIENERWEARNVHHRLERISPSGRIRTDKQRLDEYIIRIGTAINHVIKFQQTRLTGVQQHLSSLNPMAILDRGFAVISKADGKVVRTIGQVKKGELINVRVTDGEFGAKVSGVGSENIHNKSD